MGGRGRGIAGALLAACLLLAPGCSNSGGGGGGPIVIPVELVAAFGGLTFDRPVALVQHPDDPDRWYVVEQGGVIRTFLESDPAPSLSVALDISGSVDLGDVTGGGEQGLLGLALDPGFDAMIGGELYISYTDDAAGEVVLARYQSNDGGLTFTPLTVPLLAIDHTRDNHNGGDLAFGVDGDFLFYSMGDGGGAGDPDENGQDPTTLLGAILRLDVRGAAPPGLPYGIPPGNPFAGNPSCWNGPGLIPCPEIWAYGFRNPWRFGIDPMGGNLWVGDVGEDTLEEIDEVIAGRNYGWDCIEGAVNFEFVGDCAFTMFEPPEVVHSRSEARSITGGRVYRGTTVPALFGWYVYGDFVTGNVWAFNTATNGPVSQLDLDPHPIAAFGQDDEGEVYLVTFDTPSIYKLAPSP